MICEVHAYIDSEQHDRGLISITLKIANTQYLLHSLLDIEGWEIQLCL